jgi:HEAT repeat protein
MHALVLLLALGAPGPLAAGRSLADWVRDLGDKDPLVREEAVEVLAQSGPAAKEAIAQLEKMARDEPLPLRVQAALALWRVAGKTGPAVEGLAETLRKSPMLTRRLEALKTLGQLGTMAAPAVPAILDLVDAPDQGLRNQAMTTLTEIGPPAVEAVAQRLDDKDVARRRRAALGMTRLAHLARTAAPALRRHLDDEDRSVRGCCARTLWWQGDSSKPVVDALADVVRNGKAEERQEAFAAATAILDTPRIKAISPVLEIALKGPDPVNRIRAANALYLIHQKADEVLPILLEGLKDRRREVWTQAALGIGKLGPKGSPAVPALIRLLEAMDEYYCFELQEAFAGVGNAAVGPLVDLVASPKASQQLQTKVSNLFHRLGPTAAPKLLPLLEHANPSMRQLACQILGSAQGEARLVVPRLVERLSDDNMNVRLAAVGSLSRFGPAARAGLPKIVEICKAKDAPFNARFQCLAALEQIGADQPDVKALALATLDDKIPHIRGHALLLLAAGDPENPKVMPQALKLLDDPTARYQGLEVLRRLGPGAAPAVGSLCAVLHKTPDIMLRTQIANVLGAIGPAGRPAAPDLVELLKERNLPNRHLVVGALRSIGGADPTKLVPLLMDLARMVQPYERPAVLDLLGDQGSAAADAVPILLEELRKPQGSAPGAAYEQAARALGKISPERARKEGAPLVTKWMEPGPNQMFGARLMCLLDPSNKEAMTMLRRALTDKDPAHWFPRHQAAEALGALGPPARDAASELTEALKAKQAQVRMSAAYALWRINPKDSEPAVAALTDLLEPGNPTFLRVQVIRHLQEMGTAAKPALATLRRLQSDQDLPLRYQATTAVKAIEILIGKPSTP